MAMTARQAPERVLIVERDSGYRSELSSQLTAHGHRVASVASGEAALALLDQFAPTVVVSELQATASGTTLARAIRDHAASREVPILVLGDGDHADAVEHLLALGRVRYLRRGADAQTFQRTFSTLVGRAEVGLDL